MLLATAAVAAPDSEAQLRSQLTDLQQYARDCQSILADREISSFRQSQQVTALQQQVTIWQTDASENGKKLGAATAKAAELQKQLDAANKRIEELTDKLSDKDAAAIPLPLARPK